MILRHVQPRCFLTDQPRDFDQRGVSFRYYESVQCQRNITQRGFDSSEYHVAI